MFLAGPHDKFPCKYLCFVYTARGRCSKMRSQLVLRPRFVDAVIIVLYQECPLPRVPGSRWQQNIPKSLSPLTTLTPQLRNTNFPPTNFITVEICLLPFFSRQVRSSGSPNLLLFLRHHPVQAWPFVLCFLFSSESCSALHYPL